MSVTSTAPIYPKLLRLITPQNTRICPSFLHHLATEPPPPTEIPPPSVVAQVADILKTNDEESWRTNCQLNHLLFSNSSPVSSHYFLQITRQLGNSDTAFKFLQYLHSSSPSPEAASLSSTFQAICELAGREPNSQNKLLALLNTSKELNVPLTINCAISLIRLFGRAKMVNDSMIVYNELDQSLRNTHVRNVLIDVLLRCGQLDNALKVLDEMLQTAAEFPPNGNTGDIVFAGLLKFEKYERSVKEEEIVELVSKFGNYSVFPDSMRLTQLITKFCRHRKSERAWDLLHVVMESGGPVEVPSFNALLTGLGRVAEVEKMNLLMKEMKEKGIIPNVVTFGIVINHLCKSRRLDQAQEVLEKMRDGEDGVSVKPDVVIYNTLIDGLCKIGRQEEGLTLIDRMRSDDHCEPNTITYNCLIDGFCKAGELDRAHELFIAMNGSGVQPNVITINSLVDGMCRHGRISSAIEFFNKMKDKGLEGNEVTYTTLISAFCNVNNINKALDLFHVMREKCRPDAIVYFTLICGLSQAGRVDEASSIASQMKKMDLCQTLGATMY
ncbi:hypothetical protein Nepgr_024291 [Nepenthes gracilis]|uniref:Pentatricopeptide repeat-containing protein n=1 Tax=Nepenthes gracilis TaxID=150966 RepID=A0AAD3T3Q2_NEPGR|nr:hypothetical protein Nepgr_024291 [Nepenthes gracilis]